MADLYTCLLQNLLKIITSNYMDSLISNNLYLLDATGDQISAGMFFMLFASVDLEIFSIF